MYNLSSSTSTHAQDCTVDIFKYHVVVQPDMIIHAFRCTKGGAGLQAYLISVLYCRLIACIGFRPIEIDLVLHAKHGLLTRARGARDVCL